MPGLVAACPARQVLPVYAGEALGLCREQMACSGGRSSPAPQLLWQFDTPHFPPRASAPGSRALPPNRPRGWAGWGSGTGAGAHIALSGAESELTTPALLWKEEMVWVPLRPGILGACSCNRNLMLFHAGLNFLLLRVWIARGLRLLLPRPERAG